MITENEYKENYQTKTALFYANLIWIKNDSLDEIIKRLIEDNKYTEVEFHRDLRVWAKVFSYLLN